jgi:hypothetical protein
MNPKRLAVGQTEPGDRPAAPPMPRSRTAATRTHPPPPRPAFARIEALKQHGQTTRCLVQGQHGGKNQHVGRFSPCGHWPCCAPPAWRSTVHALGIDFLGELAPVGFHQPDAHHVEVENLPSRALPRCFLDAVVKLHRVAPPPDLGADHDLLVVRRSAQGLQGTSWSLTWDSAPA